MIGSTEVRSLFLEYFRKRDHEIVASSSLVPRNDPTLLFTNAGMVQFKDVFLGIDHRSYNRAASSQRCLRAGGKHNDLENVGYTVRHHTFFEMLGNFSFGDYFKRGAITYAWEFLTKELGLPTSRLWVTVFEEDNETADIWLNDVGVSAQRFSRCGKQDNFWQMGATGPCGPCTEIFYDHGEDILGSPPGSSDQMGDRYIEIWNLVFTQYNRDASGSLQLIPSPCVDTGMGLERITAVMQNVHDNYNTDIFRPLITTAKSLLACDTCEDVSLRVLADHIRACVFLISDGVFPSNEGRGYVLRRLIRRAVRHGHKLGCNEPFFYKLLPALNDVMGKAYPELSENSRQISDVLLNEEQRFLTTLERGLKHLDAIISTMDNTVISGEDLFKLYDTYGFPVDLTTDIARELNLTVDDAGFRVAMDQQCNRARAASKFSMDLSCLPTIDMQTKFSGYEYNKLLDETATVVALYQDDQASNVLHTGDTGAVVLDQTPFYADAGGQIGDTGKLVADNTMFMISDTQKQGATYIHLGSLQSGQLKIGQQISCQVDRDRRLRIMRNHSATHLLHAALRKILGNHVIQKGSLVSDHNLRFDFTYPEPVSRQRLTQIEFMVNQQILLNKETEVQLMLLDDAKKSGAISLFDEKYDDLVRVLKIGGDFSMELCGGTHVSCTGDIGLMKIMSESGVAAGVRRLEAITGKDALDWVSRNEEQLIDAANILKTDRMSVVSALKQQLANMLNLEKLLSKLQVEHADNICKEIASEAETIEGIKVSARVLEVTDPGVLRDIVDQLKSKLGTVALVFATVNQGKIALVAGVTKDITDIVDARELVNFVAHQIGGKGGGRSDIAQAGGGDLIMLDSALASVSDWVRGKAQV